MQNLEQIRAKNALARVTGAGPTSVRKQRGEGDSISGYPSLIINNGLLATLSFSLEKERQHLRIADAIAFHLFDRKIVRSPGGTQNAASLRNELAEADSLVLRRATDEALAFLSYLKRFAKASD